MYEILKSETFDVWLSKLKDRLAVAKINARLRRATLGHLGDVAPVGDGIYEMSLFDDPGYRLYFIREGKALMVLLCGGDKSTQAKDIERAKTLAHSWRT